MKKLIVANWKMNPQTEAQAIKIFTETSQIVKNTRNVDIVICPPFPYLPLRAKLKIKKISLGAQDVFYEPLGAFTGEVSAMMLKDMKAEYVIIGHSERRAMGESNDIINKKLMATLGSKLTPILCVGESARGDDASYLNAVKDQLVSCLAGMKASQIKNIVIAYEPVWALSSTINRHDATPHDFEEMKIYIRKLLTDMWGPSVAKAVRILYGGSANKDNALSFMQAGADGLLTGKASLDPKNFGAIINIAATVK